MVIWCNGEESVAYGTEVPDFHLLVGNIREDIFPSVVYPLNFIIVHDNLLPTAVAGVFVAINNKVFV